ncbi:unnamed protein product [Clonostachys byssicola]|uniref:Altered inheritance of mitochondria protein 24, mitochondrial n=1 Tax=Clonostachys byssicola TaxID=160290 RepID=A0A9N9XUL7_9HYPO|nr:unnamed protein product [Clonostachys byssicola]
MTHPTQNFEKFADTGKFEGGHFAITHRDANAVLTVTLEDKVQLLSETGAMIHMSGSIKLDAKTKISWKRFLLDDMTHSTYTGPGTVTIGPPFLGDVFALPVNSAVDTLKWVMRRECALAWTSGVTKTVKKQNFKNSFWHDEPYHVYELGGNGIMFLTGFGAVDRIDLKEGQTHFVDNGHSIAWTCSYTVVKAGGSWLKSQKTGEGRILQFEGPGSIFIQTRRLDEFEELVQACLPDTE